MTRLLGLLEVVLWRVTTVRSLGSREARLRVAENIVSVSFLGCFVTSSSSSSVSVCSDQFYSQQRRSVPRYTTQTSLNMSPSE